MVEVVSRALNTVIHYVLTIHTVPSAGLTDVIGVSNEARRITRVLTVTALQEFTTDAACADCSGCCTSGTEDRAITGRADI